MKPQSARQIRKSEQKQKSLVEAARRLFIKRGYDGTTIDDIAEEADVAKVTFYAYFKSKEEIALRIKRECAEEAVAYAETLLSKNLTADEMIKAVIVDIAEWTDENWRLLKVFLAQRFSPLLEPGPTTDCKPEPLVFCLDAIIKRGQASGLYRKNFDSLKVAHLLDLAILCEQHHWLQSGHSSREELASAIEKCFDFALHGMIERG